LVVGDETWRRHRPALAEPGVSRDVRVIDRAIGERSTKAGEGDVGCGSRQGRRLAAGGTLYVAKYTTQLTETTTGKLQWVKLGHATHAEIKALVDGGIKATDIMDSTLADPSDSSYTKIVLNKKTAWVRVKAGQEKAAAFLETHRYAALKGGSMAFTKNEGTTVNAKDKIAYSAYANIQDSMVEGGAGYVAGNNVKFKKLVAGGVVSHKLAGGQKDDTGRGDRQ